MFGLLFFLYIQKVTVSLEVWLQNAEFNGTRTKHSHCAMWVVFSINKPLDQLSDYNAVLEQPCIHSVW